ncbi:MAG: hypothetical protein JXM69_07905 [Anaerolineae bacterium]|nr:hypothetical protein [Anaerolineae bacterium]
MSTIKTRPDGLYISTHTTWPQLATDETLRSFANGLIPMALNGHQETWTLAELLHHSGPQSYPLLTTLLVLDAEVNAVVEDKQPVFPLPGFLAYRSRLSPDKFPLSAVHLPPHNRNGHYLLSLASDGFCSAVRLDLHPKFKIAGHVRLAISSPTRLPVRLQATEHRLERQPLTEELIQTAIAVGSKDLPKPLTTAEQSRVAEVLQGFIGH